MQYVSNIPLTIGHLIIYEALGIVLINPVRLWSIVHPPLPYPHFWGLPFCLCRPAHIVSAPIVLVLSLRLVFPLALTFLLIAPVLCAVLHTLRSLRRPRIKASDHHNESQTPLTCACGGTTFTTRSPTRKVSLPLVPKKEQTAPPAEEMLVTFAGLSKGEKISA